MNRRTALRALVAATAIATLSACATAQRSGPDVVTVAATNEDFSTLVTAIQVAGLEETLRGDGPFTVFAPTNAAFAALPPGTVDDLLKPENKDKLVSVLTYHVVPGNVTSDQIAGQRLDVATVQGSTIRIDAREGVRVNGANVTGADVMASNGVVHVIDAVLLPPAK